MSKDSSRRKSLYQSVGLFIFLCPLSILLFLWAFDSSLGGLRGDESETVIATNTASIAITSTPETVIATNTANIPDAISDTDAIEAIIRTITTVELLDVRIAENDAGHRTAIITYLSPLDQQDANVGAVMAAVGEMVIVQALPIDTVSAIYGVDEDTTSAAASMQMSDYRLYKEGHISIDELGEKIEIVRF